MRKVAEYSVRALLAALLTLVLHCAKSSGGDLSKQADIEETTEALPANIVPYLSSDIQIDGILYDEIGNAEVRVKVDQTKIDANAFVFVDDKLQPGSFALRSDGQGIAYKSFRFALPGDGKYRIAVRWARSEDAKNALMQSLAVNALVDTGKPELVVKYSETGITKNTTSKLIFTAKDAFSATALKVSTLDLNSAAAIEETVLEKTVVAGYEEKIDLNLTLSKDTTFMVKVTAEDMSGNRNVSVYAYMITRKLLGVACALTNYADLSYTKTLVTKALITCSEEAQYRVTFGNSLFVGNTSARQASFDLPTTESGNQTLRVEFTGMLAGDSGAFAVMVEKRRLLTETEEQMLESRGYVIELHFLFVNIALGFAGPELNGGHSVTNDTKDPMLVSFRSERYCPGIGDASANPDNFAVTLQPGESISRGMHAHCAFAGNGSCWVKSKATITAYRPR